MKYIYTAVFSTGDDGKVYARVPDLPGCISTGKNLQDAINQISDAAAGWLTVAEDEGLPIYEPTSQKDIPHESNDELTFIQIDTIAYRALTDTRAVRKNVSLPAWMATLVEKQGINCSQILQDALRNHLGI